MNPIKLKEQLVQWTVGNAGMESRTYLGMSSISECPQLLARRLTNGRNWTDEDALRCYAGYLWEDSVKARLETLGLYRRGSARELVAEFDSRYQGHTEGELRDRSLLEIKSVSLEKYLRLIRGDRPLHSHYEQVQAYMRHGRYAQAN